MASPFVKAIAMLRSCSADCFNPAWKLLLVMGLQYLAQISLVQIHCNAGKSNALQKRDCLRTT